MGTLHVREHPVATLEEHPIIENAILVASTVPAGLTVQDVLSSEDTTVIALHLEGVQCASPTTKGVNAEDKNDLVGDNLLSSSSDEGTEVSESEAESVSDSLASSRDVCSSDPTKNWYDITEREEAAPDFTLVVSKARRKSTRKAVNAESREAYLHRTKGSTQ